MLFYGNQREFIDAKSEALLERWIGWDAYKYILLNESPKREFDSEDFTALIKEPYEYFLQLNNLKSLPMYSQDSISCHSCLRIINMMHEYSRCKIVVGACDYETYEEMKKYPKVKLKISLKASQVLTDGLAFAVSLIPKEKLTEKIGVIYGGNTIDYNVRKCDMEGIIKEVSENPVCWY